MSRDNSKRSSPSPPACSEEGLGDRIQYSLLDMPYLDLQFLEGNPLGITYNEDNLGDLSGFFPPASIYEASPPTDLPFRPLYHSSTFPPQPTFHLHEPTPSTPHAPPKLFTQMPVEKPDANQADFWSPCSLVSASSLPSTRHSRSQSFSGPLVPPAQPVTPQQTPMRKPKREKSSMSTPRQDVPSSSPLIAGTWTPEAPPPSPRPHYYTPIAPNPASMPPQKHSLDGDEYDGPNAKRPRPLPPSPSPLLEMSSEDQLLLKLRDQDGLSWKEIVTKFAEDLNKDYQPAALQMRIKRLRDRMRVWTEGDVQALRLAHQYWMETKFDIIASKMLDFGSTEKWNAKQCRQKWAEMCSSSDYFSGPAYSSTMCGSPPSYQPRV